MSGSRWCFTLNNYTEDEYNAVNAVLSDEGSVTYGIVGKEVGENGTPHLQGFVIFKRTHRFGRVRNKLGPRCHIEAARGSTDQNRTYCSKDGSFVEFGNPPIQGKRSDLESVFDWADEFQQENKRPPNARELAVAFPVAFTKFPRVMDTIALRSPPIVLEEDALNDWQAVLNQSLSAAPDDRKIVFVVDPVGGKGKSYFQRYMFSHFSDKVQLLGVGRRDDVAHTIDVTKSIFFFNVPRESMQYLQYPILEQLKDRCVFSPKYQSVMKIICNKCHVVVFSNEEPDMNKMSRDRYEIINI